MSITQQSEADDLFAASETLAEAWTKATANDATTEFARNDARALLGALGFRGMSSMRFIIDALRAEAVRTTEADTEQFRAIYIEPTHEALVALAGWIQEDHTHE